MSKDYVPSDPHFLRPVGRAFVACVVVLVALAAVIPAPLKTAADPSRPPNPAKSAWFLLWIQELVSHGNGWMWPVLALVVAFVALPWLRRGHATHATWLPREDRPMSAIAVALSLTVVALTLVGFFLRGERWRLVWPW